MIKVAEKVSFGGVEGYRPNVAALLMNRAGKLLICERVSIPGAWQFPQGGIDPGETAREALIREVREEVGLDADDFTIEASRGGYRYDYPKKMRRLKPPHKKKFRGQEQRYFRCRVKEEARPIDLSGKPREFSRYCWIEPADFNLAWLPDFKKETYRRVLADFFGVEVADRLE